MSPTTTKGDDKVKTLGYFSKLLKIYYSEE